jgi:PAS domain S-box-containing protein
MDTKTNKYFVYRIIIPVILTVALFVIVMFFVFIPRFERAMMERKQEMIRELVNSSWSILWEYHNEEMDSLLSRKEAQELAINKILHLRYGDEAKDYFWITDMEPRMIMHPYRSDLNGELLNDYADPNGKKLFVEAVDLVRKQNQGFIKYMWQWKDDSTRIVPKLSYVKEFTPWAWIIGTGIYLQDVRNEIATLKNHFTRIALGIAALISLLLFYILRHSLKTEDKRKEAVDALIESRERYRMLVEASTEAIIMMMDSRIIYFNRNILDLSGYSSGEFANISIKNILPDFTADEHNSERRLLTQQGSFLDVTVSTSPIMLGEKQAYVLIINDISTDKQIRQELSISKEKYDNLTRILNIAVFRITLGREARFIEANEATLNILGFEDFKTLAAINILDLFVDKEQKRSFLNDLDQEGSIKNRIIKIRNARGAKSISVSMVVSGEGESGAYADGIIDDISSRRKLEEEKEKQLEDLRDKLAFFEKPVKAIMKGFEIAYVDTSVESVIKILTSLKSSGIVIVKHDKEVLGSISREEVLKALMDMKFDFSRKASSLMHAPIHVISGDEKVSQAIFRLRQSNSDHVLVFDDAECIGVVTAKELLGAHEDTIMLLNREIMLAHTNEELRQVFDRIPGIVDFYLQRGTHASRLTRHISVISDQILHRVIQLALEILGPAPVDFAFLVMGSVARKEQTLVTDQDNGIVYSDEAAGNEDIAQYFLKLGTLISDSLHTIGYDYCKGNNMASNPKWNKPLSTWKSYFSEWIENAQPVNLLDLSIFFDFEVVYGNKKYENELHKHIQKSVRNKAVFFYHLAQNALDFKAPLNMFGNVVSGDDNSFDIKKSIMAIIGFTRVYTLLHGLSQTNTLDRLQELRQKAIIKEQLYDNIIQAYEYLMLLRFKSQLKLIGQNKKLSNSVNIKSLSSIEVSMLKKVFSQISEIQAQLNIDFKGSAI